MAQPNTKQIERQGLNAQTLTRRYPKILGGVCEFCGIMDKNAESIYQYKLCEHYRGMDMACTYCSATRDQDDVIRKSELKVADNPADGGRTLVVWCDSYECSEKHLARWS